MIRRNFVLASLAASVVVPARANQQVIGWVSPENRETVKPFYNAFMAGLHALPGGNQVQVLDRYILDGAAERYATAVEELQQKDVALILAQGAATPGVVRANPTVPVVFAYSADPVVGKIVQSLARPGGKATGVTFMSVELNPKRIDFVRTALPKARKIGLLSNINHFGEENEIAACQTAVQQAGAELTVYRVTALPEIQPAVVRALDDGIEVLVVLPSAGMVRYSSEIIRQCLARKVPVVSGWSSFAHAGALLTYGPNLGEGMKRVAWYTMRVLGGARPSDLPVEQPTKLELVVNRKTAAQLGIDLPIVLLAQAEEIIE